MGSTLPDSFIILYASTLYVLLLLCSDAAHVLMQLPFFVCCNKDGRDGGVQRSMYSCKDGRAPARQFAADRSQFVNSRICKRSPLSPRRRFRCVPYRRVYITNKSCQVQ